MLQCCHVRQVAQLKSPQEILGAVKGQREEEKKQTVDTHLLS